MTNEQRQKSLDKKKWSMSKECNQDLSGKMTYCEFCYYQNKHDKCKLSQKMKNILHPCATAYNRMKRR